MNPGDETIRSLRAVLQVSPDNVPLRRHLADALMNLGRYDEAEQELRETLSASPHDPEIKLDLARAYLQQDKTSQAMVVVEDLVNKRDSSGAAHLLYARLLLREGDPQRAVAQYKLALEIDPDCADNELGGELGVVADDQPGEVYDGRVRQSFGDSPSQGPVEMERPETKFAQVGGMEGLKEEIGMKIIMPLKHPEMYRAYGKEVGGGILMYGPPGCGKTWLARATAGEIEAGFVCVGISDVLDMWIGASERNLHEVFDRARYNKPCVLFFDEVDALGGRRSDTTGHSRQVINQFLAEMDGVNSANEGLLILAATNAPWHVDPAFRRPGRFDRVLFVPPPDLEGRAAIFRIHLRDKPLGSIDYHQLAKKTEGFSGADVKAVVELAVEAKLREAFRVGSPQPITNKDLLAAAKSVRASTREWFSTARNYALYSNQGGLYDDVLKYLNL